MVSNTDLLDKDFGDCIVEMNILAKQMQAAIEENSRKNLDQNEYGRKYTELVKRYDSIKEKRDKIKGEINGKREKRELLKGFIQTLEKQGALVEEFDEGLWSSLVQEVVVNAKDDIRFIFKNGFEVRV